MVMERYGLDAAVNPVSHGEGVGVLSHRVHHPLNWYRTGLMSVSTTIWRPRRALSCREDLATALREAILSGEMAAGSALPGERELSETSGLARGTVRSALDALQAEGVITCSHGRRRTVATSRVATKTIAVLANDRNPRPDLWVWPGVDAWLQLGFAQNAFARGWHVLTLHPESLVADGGVGLQANGILLSTTAFDVAGAGGLVASLHRRGVTMVGVSDDPALARTDRVVHDHAAGCAALVRALAARGARRILPWWGRRAHHDPWWLAARERGWRNACAELGLALLTPRLCINPLIEDEDADWDTLAIAETAELLPILEGPDPPDALLTVNDQRAHLLAHGLRSAGLGGRMPLLAGYDASGRFGVPAEMPDWRPVLTVDRDNERIAGLAVDLLLERLSGTLPSTAQRRLIPPAAVRDADGNPA